MECYVAVEFVVRFVGFVGAVVFGVPSVAANGVQAAGLPANEQGVWSLEAQWEWQWVWLEVQLWWQQSRPVKHCWEQTVDE